MNQPTGYNTTITYGVPDTVQKRVWYQAAMCQPCNQCNQTKYNESHYPTCDGRNLCKSCWDEQHRPQLQVFPGDTGTPQPIIIPPALTSEEMDHYRKEWMARCAVPTGQLISKPSDVTKIGMTGPLSIYSNGIIPCDYTKEEYKPVKYWHKLTEGVPITNGTYLVSCESASPEEPVLMTAVWIGSCWGGIPQVWAKSIKYWMAIPAMPLDKENNNV